MRFGHNCLEYPSSGRSGALRSLFLVSRWRSSLSSCLSSFSGLRTPSSVSQLPCFLGLSRQALTRNQGSLAKSCSWIPNKILPEPLLKRVWLLLKPSSQVLVPKQSSCKKLQFTVPIPARTLVKGVWLSLKPFQTEFGLAWVWADSSLGWLEFGLTWVWADLSLGWLAFWADLSLDWLEFGLAEFGLTRV